MPHPNLETARLLLRPVTPEDYQAVFHCVGDTQYAKQDGSEIFPAKIYRWERS